LGRQSRAKEYERDVDGTAKLHTASQSKWRAEFLRVRSGGVSGFGSKPDIVVTIVASRITA
jgi:hypothetical protein